MKKIFVFTVPTDEAILVELSALAEDEQEARNILKSQLLLDAYKRPTHTGIAMMKWDHRMVMKVRVCETLIDTMPLTLTIPDSYVNEFNVHLCKDDVQVKDTEDTISKLKTLQDMRPSNAPEQSLTS